MISTLVQVYDSETFTKQKVSKDFEFPNKKKRVCVVLFFSTKEMHHIVQNLGIL